MILLDTNIFTYLANGTISPNVVAKKDIYFTSICKIEALGYSNITVVEQSYLEQLFDECYQIDLDEQIIKRAITLRLQKKMSLGDAIVAAAAIESGCVLWTANIENFDDIDELKTFNPLKKDK